MEIASPKTARNDRHVFDRVLLLDPTQPNRQGESGEQPQDHPEELAPFLYCHTRRGSQARPDCSIDFFHHFVRFTQRMPAFYQ